MVGLGAQVLQVGARWTRGIATVNGVFLYSPERTYRLFADLIRGHSRECCACYRKHRTSVPRCASPSISLSGPHTRLLPSFLPIAFFSDMTTIYFTTPVTFQRGVGDLASAFRSSHSARRGIIIS